MRVWALLLMAGLGVPGPLVAQSGATSAAGQVQLHQQRAHQLLSEKKPELAAKEFAAVLAADPNNLDAEGNLGVLLYFQKDYAGAEPHLRAAIEQQPSLTKIRALLGMCERRLGKTDAARTDLEAVVGDLEDASIRMEVGLQLIEIDSASQDLARAATVVETLRQKAPTDPRVLYAAYRIYTDLAGEALLGLSVAAPEAGQMYQAMAHELVRQRDMNGAITDFRKALAADPHLPGIHYELAEALHASPDLKLRGEAEEQYRLAVAANPADEKAVTRLGDTALDKGDLDGAAERYQQALKLAPHDADALIGMARVSTEKNDPEAALPLLERVVAADASNVQAHYRLSVVYRKLKRPEDAKRELAEYQKYKDLKEKLRKIYKDLRLEEGVAEPDKEGR
ncbi:tetratricopeptide repeat protein [Edaphobacter modestus]|uniref:Tetratricopeptide repeat protein n=1 Tax=Edaphobacter modestus TaxID=388466 RepID=A0A4Q7YVE9_9BACT|nr:tetratricopeptide repeat protein [Edaphobacter modestus]RZU41033.1 tetratricopeptide repeat protein [Edaphobacter modestus]